MKQYIDFFEQSRSRIDQSCAPLLNAQRDRAFDAFRQTGFPDAHSEEYRSGVDVAAWLKGDLGFYLRPSDRRVDPRRMFPCTISNLHACKHYVVNGWFYGNGATPDLPPGVFSGSLNVFAEQYPQVFARYYNRLAATKGDGLSAFNTAFVQDGYVLYVPPNTATEKIFQLTNVSGGRNDSLTNRRILVIIEAGAQAKLLVCDHTTGDASLPVATQVVEIYAGEGASFDGYEMEESSRNTVRLTANFVQQEAASTVILHTLTLNNGVTRNNYHADLNGPDAELQLNGIVIADQRQLVDNFTQIHHNAPRCRCREWFKYILDDEAMGAFSGKIVVAPDAQQTNAFQSNRNLLGSPRCRMYSKPQLEIYADDVKCSHGMTTGQLDETALFYMRSRGIPEEEAILLLKFAFTHDVLQGIRIDGLRERLTLLIDKRFRGESIQCQGCI